LPNRGWGCRAETTGDCAGDGEVDGREEIETNSPGNGGDCGPYSAGRDGGGIVGDGMLQLNGKRGR
jgi:hypothetical protein